ncbi:MAG: hypothetical protein ACM3US_14795 [Sphingomonadaceae bacterium]
MNRRFGAIAVLLLAVMLGFFFFWVDFWAAIGQTRTNSQVSTYSMTPQGSRDSGPTGTLTVFVPGDDPLEVAFKRELVSFLEKGTLFGDTRLVDSPAANPDGPAVTVEIAERDLLWTPIRAQARLMLKLAYASDGDLSWRDDRVVHMETRSEAGMRRVRAEFQVEDTSYGVISRPAYIRRIGRAIAADVQKALEKAADPSRVRHSS